MKKVVILGGSGIGMIAASIIDRIGDAEVVGFLNDVIETGTEIGKKKKIKVIGTTNDLWNYIGEDNTYVFVAYVGFKNEKKFYEKIKLLNIPEHKFYDVIDPNSIIPYDYCNIGKGILLAPFSQLSPDSTISNNCMLLANSFVGHDSFLDEYTHLATNAVVGANVHVGKSVHIGSNATIREYVNIGDYSLIGGGSMVVKDVPNNCIVVGNPAKILRFKE
jgi:acetyltransferase EpsM